MGLWQTSKRLWAAIGTSREQLKILTGAAVLIVGALGYCSARSEYSANLNREEANRRKQETLNYIARYRDGTVGEAARSLDGFWASPAGQALWKSVGDSDFASRVTTALSDKGLELRIRELAYFYENLSVCVVEGVCDRDTACSFFFEDMRGFRNLYQDYLQAWSRSWQRDPLRHTTSLLDEKCERQIRAYSEARPQTAPNPSPTTVKEPHDASLTTARK